MATKEFKEKALFLHKHNRIWHQRFTYFQLAEQTTLKNVAYIGTRQNRQLLIDDIEKNVLLIEKGLN